MKDDMKDEIKHGLFEVLDPPPGGIAKLRERLDADDRSMSRVKRFAFVAAPALAIAAAVLLVMNQPRVPDLVGAAKAHGGVDEVALGLSNAQQASVVIAPTSNNAGLVPVKTENPNVSFYWVATTE
jgi:hypothetical protein